MSSATLGNYDLGQCTWFVAEQVNWIGLWGNASQWLSSAQAAGLPTGSTPMIGAVAVWAPNAGGASAFGHVALVTGIQANGLPQVAEMNWSGGPGVVDYRNVDPGSAAGIAGYIYSPDSTHPTPPSSTVTPDASMAGVQTAWDQLRGYFRDTAPGQHNDLVTIANNTRRIG